MFYCPTVYIVWTAVMILSLEIFLANYRPQQPLSYLLLPVSVPQLNVLWFSKIACCSYSLVTGDSFSAVLMTEIY